MKMKMKSVNHYNRTDAIGSSFFGFFPLAIPLVHADSAGDAILVTLRARAVPTYGGADWRMAIDQHEQLQAQRHRENW